MAFAFHDLPFDLCREVVWKWVAFGESSTFTHRRKDILDILALDVAHCNHSQRKLYLDWIRNMTIRVDVPKQQYIPFVIWIMTRGLRIQEIYFGDEMVVPLYFMMNMSAEFFIHLHGVFTTCYALHESHRGPVTRLLSRAPALRNMHVSVSPFSLKETYYFIEALPNPHLLRTMYTQFSDNSLQPDAAQWWTLTPNLTHLDIWVEGETLPSLMVHQLSATLLLLEELSIMGKDSVEWILTPQSAPICFPRLKVLHFENMTCSCDTICELLRGCPVLTGLKIGGLEFLQADIEEEAMSALELETMTVLLSKVPQLQYFEWSSDPPGQVEDTWCNMVLRAPEGQTLGSVFTGSVDIAYALSEQGWFMVPLRLLDCLPIEDRDGLPRYLEALVVYGGYPVEFPDDKDCNFVTDLCMTRSTLATRDWTTILTLFPRAKTVDIGDQCSDFEEGLKKCATTGVQSRVSTLTVECTGSSIAALLPLVFPNLTTLTFSHAEVTAGDVLLLFRLPKLTSLTVGGTCTTPLKAIRNVSSAEWLHAACSTSCATVELKYVSIEQWDDVRRMVDSFLGRKLQKVTVSVANKEHAAWRELQAREHAYFQSPERCQVCLKF